MQGTVAALMRSRVKLGSATSKLRSDAVCHAWAPHAAEGRLHFEILQPVQQGLRAWPKRGMHGAHQQHTPSHVPNNSPAAHLMYVKYIPQLTLTISEL